MSQNNFKINKLLFTLFLSNLVFMIFTFSMNFVQDIRFLFLLQNFYGQICHQIENRSFFIYEKPMLICSRCSGIFAGSLIFFFLLAISKKILQLLNKLNYKLILLTSLPLIVDWSLNFIFNIESSNFVRFLTGFSFSLLPVFLINSTISESI